MPKRLRRHTKNTGMRFSIRDGGLIDIIVKEIDGPERNRVVTLEILKDSLESPKIINLYTSRGWYHIERDLMIRVAAEKLKQMPSRGKIVPLQYGFDSSHYKATPIDK